MKPTDFTPMGAWPWPAEYAVLRILSEGEGGIVALARKSSGELMALKLLRLAQDANPDEALTRHDRLRRLTAAPGLLQISACGLTADRLWLWEELELADNLDGGPASAGDDYQPATLRGELIERGPLSTEAALSVGLTICAALETLHAHGLVHRDVKPGNLLRVGGKVVLGDYGLTAPPGTPFDFKGTEGFVPSEGSADAAADLFALGKTLYELWTGCDRLEFPTIPKPILTGSGWLKNGSAFNEVLLRTCSPRAQERYQTAAELADALRGAATGQAPGITRRRWLGIAAGTGGVAACGGFYLWLTRPKPTAHWRRLKQWGHVPQSWGPHQAVLDESRRCFYQFLCSAEEKVVHRIDLGTFNVERKDLKLGDLYLSRPVLHPLERNLWFVEGNHGPVWRIDPESWAFSRVAGQKPPNLEGSGYPFWNPLTKRLGDFGGYVLRTFLTSYFRPKWPRRGFGRLAGLAS